MRWPRTLGLGLGGLCVGVAIWEAGQTSPWVWALLAFNALAWPQLAYWRAMRSRRPFPAERHNLLIDSLLGGFWLPVMGFSVLPSALIAAMLTMDNIAVGGRRLFLRGLCALAAGAAIGWLLQGRPWVATTSLATVLACLPFLIAYPLVIGLTTYSLARRLSEQRRAHEKAEVAYRDVLDAMDAGIVLYDADDRLVLFNRRFAELYASIAPRLKPGMRFEDLLRQAVAAGFIPEARGREEAWLAERVQTHQQAGTAFVREFPNRQWRRIVEQRLPDGGLLAFSTDVTDLKLHEAELEQLIGERDAYARALQEANQRLDRLSNTDALTGLANRRQFDRRLQEEWTRAQRHGLPLALLMIDVDHFKRYNDAHGHVDGDECLRRIGIGLSACAARATDLVARYGGEEFVLLLPHTDPEEALLVARRCMEAVDAAAIEHRDSPTSTTVTVSIGAAAMQPAIDQPPAALVRMADAALYAAKLKGRHRVESTATVQDRRAAPREMVAMSDGRQEGPSRSSRRFISGC